jgi:hypothetical protein
VKIVTKNTQIELDAFANFADYNPEILRKIPAFKDGNFHYNRNPQTLKAVAKCIDKLMILRKTQAFFQTCVLFLTCYNLWYGTKMAGNKLEILHSKNSPRPIQSGSCVSVLLSAYIDCLILQEESHEI